MMRLLSILVKDIFVIIFICSMYVYELLYLLGCCEKVRINYVFVMMSLKF